VNYVDLIVILLVVISVIEGVRKGGSVQLFNYAGLALGLGIGALLASPAAKLVSPNNPIGRTVVSTVVLFGSAMLMAAAGRVIGSRIAAGLNRARLGPADAAAGAGISFISTLVVVWLMAGMLSNVPIEKVSQGIQGSKVIQALNHTFPPTPSVFSRIRQVLASAGFPQVFAELEPAPDAQVPLPSDAQLRAAVEAAGASTLKVSGIGCGGTLSGSGFVVAPGLLMTNAHVVAGIAKPQVLTPRGFLAATPMVFDSSTDVAVLKVKGLAAKPLQLSTATAPRGQSGAVLGYPGGGPFKVVPAAIIDQIPALGRDIYGRKLASREVYRLKAEVRPGNSGGPLVTSTGSVLGVVFSASAVKPDIGYALTAKQVAPKIAEAGRAQAPVDTGPCAE